MTPMSHAEALVHRMLHQIVPHSFKETYSLLVATGLSTHTAAFGLTLMLVPKYARELNPIASSSGLIQYFPITVAVSLVAYYWIWRSNMMTRSQKMLFASAIAGIAVFDFLIDLDAFVQVIGIRVF